MNLLNEAVLQKVKIHVLTDGYANQITISTLLK